MNNIAIVFFIVAVICIAITVFFKYKKSKLGLLATASIPEPELDDIEGELRFMTIVAWLKSQHLVEGEDIAFICVFSKEHEKLFSKITVPDSKVAYAIGVYNENKDAITALKIVSAISVDKVMKATMKEDLLVVLES